MQEKIIRETGSPSEALLKFMNAVDEAREDGWGWGDLEFNKYKPSYNGHGTYHVVLTKGEVSGTSSEVITEDVIVDGTEGQEDSTEQEAELANETEKELLKTQVESMKTVKELRTFAEGKEIEIPKKLKNPQAIKNFLLE